MHRGLKTGPLYPMLYIKFLQQNSRSPPPYLIPNYHRVKKERNAGINVYVAIYSCLPSTAVPLTAVLRRIPTAVPIVELSLDSGLFSISIPQDQGKYLVHQAEPLCVVRLNTTGRSPGIQRVPLKTDSPTVIHP